MVLIRHEADDDFHLVISDGKHTMITESPAPICDSRAFPARQAQIAAARRALRLRPRARVSVAFFDFDHGQTGVAPNAIELHPILTFRCLSGAASAGGGSASAGTGHTPGSSGLRVVQVTTAVSAGSDASVTGRGLAGADVLDHGQLQERPLPGGRPLPAPGHPDHLHVDGRVADDPRPLADHHLVRPQRVDSDIVRRHLRRLSSDGGVGDAPSSGTEGASPRASSAYGTPPLWRLST